VYRFTFVSCHLVFGWHPSRLCPWTAAFFDTSPIFTIAQSHTKFISSSMQTTRNFTWLCRLAVIHMIFLHFSLVWTLFTFGFVKMAWPSTHSVWHITDTQISGHKSVNVARTVIPVSDKVEILGATLDSNLTMEHHTKTLSSSCFITSAHLNRFVYPWYSDRQGAKCNIKSTQCSNYQLTRLDHQPTAMCAV